jgi:Type III restriction enzyme, res subunit
MTRCCATVRSIGSGESWRSQGHPGATRTTLELIQWWTREGREKPLFFAQLEAALTVIFLKEARADFLQGLAVPRDEPSDDRKEKEGYSGFERYACKMATGSGKTTVMGMLAAWSILNKLNNRGDARFSDVVLVVCPNVTIRQRLAELKPEFGEASIYRTRDLVPTHLMPLLTQGKVVVTNWHVFEPQTMQTGGVKPKREVLPGEYAGVRRVVRAQQERSERKIAVSAPHPVEQPHENRNLCTREHQGPKLRAASPRSSRLLRGSGI